MINNLKLHWDFIKMHISTRMAYRFDFFISLFAYFIFEFIAPIFVGVIYLAGGRFPGWDYSQILLIQGSLTLIRGFSQVVFFGLFSRTEHKVRSGTLDQTLIWPVNTLWLMIMDSFDEEDIARLFGGIVIISIALSIIGDVGGSWVLFLIVSSFGVLFMFSLALLLCALTIKFVQTGRMREFLGELFIIASYPKTVYSKGIGTFFSVFFPLLIISFYPASALLGFPLDQLMLSIISILVLLAISLVIWHKALKQYSGAGG